MLGFMGQHSPSRSLSKLIFDQTEGNPFFVEEVYRHLAEEGKLFDENGAWLQKGQLDSGSATEKLTSEAQLGWKPHARAGGSTATPRIDMGAAGCLRAQASSACLTLLQWASGRRSRAGGRYRYNRS